MGEVGCYDLNLYCDRCGSRDPTGYHPGTFMGRNLADARREAKRAGWRFNFRLAANAESTRPPYVLCPSCAKTVRTP